MSGDRKVTQLPTLVSPASEDLIHIVDNPSGTPVSKKITVGGLFGNINANTAINGTLSVTGNTSMNVVSAQNITANSTISAQLSITGNRFKLAGTFTPGSSNLSDVDYPIGTITYDVSYLYIKVAPNTIKRVALTSF